MPENACPFCQAVASGDRIVIEVGSVAALRDKYPVTQGHHLVVTKQHVADFFAMTAAERRDAELALEALREKILAQDTSVKGFNIGINCGEVAGQTVMHAHIHLIPRREGDVAEPRGGVRGCVPHKMNY